MKSVLHTNHLVLEEAGQVLPMFRYKRQNIAEMEVPSVWTYKYLFYSL